MLCQRKGEMPGKGEGVENWNFQILLLRREEWNPVSIKEKIVGCSFLTS